MNRFAVNKEPGHDDKYYVSVTIVIYRAKHKKYPDFLEYCENERNKREGYPTKFGYCTEHVMLGKEEAESIAAMLENKYAKKIEACEESGDWSESPFDFGQMDLLWSR